MSERGTACASKSGAAIIKDAAAACHRPVLWRRFGARQQPQNVLGMEQGSEGINAVAGGSTQDGRLLVRKVANLLLLTASSHYKK